jgi:hypothetical protein
MVVVVVAIKERCDGEIVTTNAFDKLKVTANVKDPIFISGGVWGV